MRDIKVTRFIFALFCLVLLLAVLPAAKVSAVELPSEVVAMLDLRLLRASSYSINQENRTVSITAAENVTNIGIYKAQDGSLSASAHVELTPDSFANVSADPTTGFIKVTRPSDTGEECAVSFPMYYYEGWYRFKYNVTVTFPAISIPDLRVTGAESYSIDNATHTIHITPKTGVAYVGILNTQNGTFGQYGYLTDYDTSGDNPYVKTDSETGFIRVSRPAASECSMGFHAVYQQGAYKADYIIIVDFPEINIDLETVRAIRVDNAVIDNTTRTIHITPSAEGTFSVGIYKTQHGAFDEHVYLEVVGGLGDYVSVDGNGFITVKRPDTTSSCTMGFGVSYKDLGVTTYYSIYVDFPAIDINLSDVRTLRVDNAVIDDSTRTIRLTPSAEGVFSVGIYKTQNGAFDKYVYLEVFGGLGEYVRVDGPTGFITVKRPDTKSACTMGLGVIYKDSGVTAYYSIYVDFPAIDIDLSDVRAIRVDNAVIDNTERTIHITPSEEGILSVGIYKTQNGAYDEHVYLSVIGELGSYVSVDANGFIRVKRPDTAESCSVPFGAIYKDHGVTSNYVYIVDFPAINMVDLRADRDASYSIDNSSRTVTVTAEAGALNVGIRQAQNGSVRKYGYLSLHEGSSTDNVTIDTNGYIRVARPLTKEESTVSLQVDYAQGVYVSTYTINVVFPENNDMGLLDSLLTSTTVASFDIDNSSNTITLTARDGAMKLGIYKSQRGILIATYGHLTVVDDSAGENISVDPTSGCIFVNRSDSADEYTESFEVEAEFTQGADVYKTVYTVNVVFPAQ